jgi:glycosyltransferase involved in cell wall biosynthesis
MPAVSVAITAYNSAPWVTEAVRPALDQAMSEIEVIGCDHTSTDDAYAVVAAINGPRLRVYRNSTNLRQVMQRQPLAGFR